MFNLNCNDKLIWPGTLFPNKWWTKHKSYELVTIGRWIFGFIPIDRNWHCIGIFPRMVGSPICHPAPVSPVVPYLHDKEVLRNEHWEPRECIWGKMVKNAIQQKVSMVEASAFMRPVVQRYWSSSCGSYIGKRPSMIFSDPGFSKIGHVTQLVSMGSRMNLKRSRCSFPGFRDATHLVTLCTFCSPASVTTALAVATALLADSRPSPRRSSLGICNEDFLV